MFGNTHYFILCNMSPTHYDPHIECVRSETATVNVHISHHFVSKNRVFSRSLRTLWEMDDFSKVLDRCIEVFNQRITVENLDADDRMAYYMHNIITNVEYERHMDAIIRNRQTIYEILRTKGYLGANSKVVMIENENLFLNKSTAEVVDRTYGYATFSSDFKEQDIYFNHVY